jgi:hypothetical protein
VLSARTSTGWRSWDLTVPHESATGGSGGKGNEYRFFSEDLSVAILQPFGAFDAGLTPEASEQTALLHFNFLNGNPGERCEEHEPGALCYQPLVTGKAGHENVPPGTEFGNEGRCPPTLICGPEFVEATPDGKHVLLTLEPKPGQAGLYEWSSGALQFVSAGELGNHNSANTRHALSADGSRVFVREGENLYMSDLPRKALLQLDLAEPGCGTCTSGGAVFQDASADGSRVLFTDERRLTKDAGATTAAPDLYECRIVEETNGPRCELSDLTPLNADTEGAAVQGLVLGESEDGSWVYFVANGVLENNGQPIAGAVRGTCARLGPPQALCNLYLRHDGETSLVAVLHGADSPDWATTDAEAGLEKLVAHVSPDGQWLAFMSERELTGYDNHDANSGQPDEEVYLYDGATHSLVCASCDPTEARPHGVPFTVTVEGIIEPNIPTITGAEWENSSWLAASLPTWTPFRLGRAPHQPRVVFDTGRLFFDSHDALVPQDGNNNWDVYEYEPAGVGSCTEASAGFAPSSGGCVALISSGTFAGESTFLEASAAGGRNAEGDEGGSDVFFLTAAQLVPQDVDNAVDVYDAHECSAASPCIPPPPEELPPCASADACRAAPSPQTEVFAAPASALFTGEGDPSTPTPAAKTTAEVKAEDLAKAYKACKAKKKQRQRATCMSAARRRYGSPSAPASKKRKTTKVAKRGRRK